LREALAKHEDNNQSGSPNQDGPKPGQSNKSKKGLIPTASKWSTIPNKATKQPGDNKKVSFKQNPTFHILFARPFLSFSFLNV